jgi:hypothetical protein
MHVNARLRQQVSLIDLTGPGGPINPPVKPEEGHDVEGRCHRSIVKTVGINRDPATLEDAHRIDARSGYADDLATRRSDRGERFADPARYAVARNSLSNRAINAGISWAGRGGLKK